MSVEAMAVVLHHSQARGTTKLVLLGIANHEGDGGAWPTLATLARYANTEVRTVQRSIDKLTGSGELEVDRQRGGTPNIADQHRPNLFRVRVRCPPWCDRTTRHRDTRTLAGRQLELSTGVGKPVDNRGDASVTPPPDLSTGVTPVSPGGVTPTSPKPSLEPTTTNHPAASLQDARACAVCGQAASRCVPAQLAYPLEDRHTYTPRRPGGAR